MKTARLLAIVTGWLVKRSRARFHRWRSHTPMPINQHSKTRTCIQCLAFPLVLTASSMAQDDLDEARILRSDLRDQEMSIESRADWNVAWLAGLAYTKLERGGHSWNTPLQFGATKGHYKVIVQTDGFADYSAPANESGFSDVLVQVRRRLWRSATAPQSLSLSGGATIPVGGEIGSDYTKERATLSFNSGISETASLAFSGSVRRSEAAAKANRNPYSQVLTAMLSRKISGKTLFGQIVSSHPNGSKWSWSALAGYEFPINPKLVGTFVVSRGFSAGRKHTGIEFDLGW